MNARVGSWVLGVMMIVALAWVSLVSYAGTQHYLARVVLIAAGALALTGAIVALRASPPVPPPRLVDVIAGAAAAAATLLMSRSLSLPPVVSAGIVLVVLGVATWPGGPLDDQGGRAGYAGVFVGLIAPSVTVPLWWIVLAGALAGFLWSLIAKSAMAGIGGRIGLAAFMASAGVYWLGLLLDDVGNAPLVPLTEGLANWVVVPIGVIAAVVCWTLYHRTPMGFMMSVGLPTLLVSGGIALAIPGVAGQQMSTAWFGACAIVSTSLACLPNAGWVGVTGLLFGALMVRFQGPLQGHAGVIGVIADLAVLAVFGFRQVTPWVGRRLPPRRLPGQARVP